MLAIIQVAPNTVIQASSLSAMADERELVLICSGAAAAGEMIKKWRAALCGCEIVALTIDADVASTDVKLIEAVLAEGKVPLLVALGDEEAVQAGARLSAHRSMPPNPRRTRKARNWRLIAVSVGLATAVAVAGMAVLAGPGSTANTFSSPSVDLDAGSTQVVGRLAGIPSGGGLTHPVIVANTTQRATVYAISARATNPDGMQLKDRLVLIVTTSVAARGVPCHDAKDEPLYLGDLDSVDGRIVGDPRHGPDSRNRTLAAGASETLCFHVRAPHYTDSRFAQAATTVTFTFHPKEAA